MSIIRSTVHFIVKWTPLMKIVRLFLRPFIHRRGIWRVAYRLPLVGKQKVPIPNGEELLLETDRTDDIYKVLFWKGFEGFEKETVDLFMDLSKGSKVIFDIGANTGYYSLIAAKVNPDSIIIGFEPLPAALSAFKRNVEINKINNIIQVFERNFNFFFNNIFNEVWNIFRIPLIKNNVPICIFINIFYFLTG